ncbi:MAG: class IV adenylate cyclase [Bacteroidota bacterium]
MHINIEIKARCADAAAAKALLLAKKADFKGIDHQIDTYFKVKNGRMKLREGQIENSLIHYQRSDQAGPKQSNVTLYHPKDTLALKSVLTNALETLVAVDKFRAIYFIENVKFHVDEVKHLGHFVEIEAIDAEGTLGVDYLKQQCTFYMEYLGIEADSLIEQSYSDLLREE